MPERNCKTTKFQKSLEGGREREREREILHAIDSAENFEEFDKSPHTHFCSIWIAVAQQSMHKDAKLPDLSRLCSTWEDGCLVAK
jgi:hypothetical protein